VKDLTEPLFENTPKVTHPLPNVPLRRFWKSSKRKAMRKLIWKAAGRMEEV
jgi:hypothetical protein